MCCFFLPSASHSTKLTQQQWTGINNGPESELIADSPQSAIDELKKKREKEKKEKEEAHAKGEKTEDEKKKEEKEKK